MMDSMTCPIQTQLSTEEACRPETSTVNIVFNLELRYFYFQFLNCLLRQAGTDPSIRFKVRDSFLKSW